MNQNKQSGFVKWLLITISVLFLFVMLVLPLLVVITQAFKSGVAAYLKAVTDKYTVRALLLTLEATLTAVVVNTIFGLFAAWTITKFKFKGKKLLTTLIDIHSAVRKTEYFISDTQSVPYQSCICSTGYYPGNCLCNISVYFKRTDSGA